MSKKQDNAVVNRHVVRRLLKYGKPYIGWFLLILLIIVGTVRLELWQPELIEQASEQYVEKYLEKQFLNTKCNNTLSGQGVPNGCRIPQ